jgi:TonB family protein
MTLRGIFSVGCILSLLAGNGCAYYNTLYNARRSFREALDIKARADPERLKISTQEEQLYAAAFEKASRVVREHEDSRWVDDALLLMGKVSYEQGDYSKAQRTFDEVLVGFPDSNLREEALVMQARTLIATKEYAEAAAKLDRAEKIDKKEWRDEIVYFKGLAQYEQGNAAEALVAFDRMLKQHKSSEWFAEAGMQAGEIALAQGDTEAAVRCFEHVRADAKVPEDRYRGGMEKGRALIEAGEYERARTTFRDVAKRTLDEENRSEALLMMGKAIDASGDFDGAVEVYASLLEKYPRREVAAEAQYTIARHYDTAGDLERAAAEYELVKEQGTGHPASQDAAARQVEIQKVLELRTELAGESVEEPERKRFLLAETLLEKIGDPRSAVSEYRALAEDANGTEWGARSLLASAWVLEHKLDEPDTARALLFRLANTYSGTDADGVARQRLGYPVWRVEEVDPGPVQFIRPEGDDAESSSIFVNRVEPRDVPLPEGVDLVEVWVRLGLNPDGTVKSSKIVRSGGEEFDAAVLEATQASTFVGPNAGGPEFTVQQYSFPVGASTDASPPAPEEATPSPAHFSDDDEPSDALTPPPSVQFQPDKTDSLSRPETLFSTPDTTPDTTSSPTDSSAESSAPLPRLRGNDFDRSR